jgi:hypothetical protein
MERRGRRRSVVDGEGGGQLWTGKAAASCGEAVGSGGW